MDEQQAQAPQPAAPAAPAPAPAAAPQPAAPQAAPAPAQAAAPQPAAGAPASSPDEQIGFHKGALSTLAKERQELVRILQIVEQLMQMHVNGLKELGVDLEAMAGSQQAAPAASAPKPSQPIDDLVNQ